MSSRFSLAKQNYKKENGIPKSRRADLAKADHKAAHETSLIYGPKVHMKTDPKHPQRRAVAEVGKRWKAAGKKVDFKSPQWQAEVKAAKDKFKASTPKERLELPNGKVIAEGYLDNALTKQRMKVMLKKLNVPIKVSSEVAHWLRGYSLDEGTRKFLKYINYANSLLGATIKRKNKPDKVIRSVVITMKLVKAVDNVDYSIKIGRPVGLTTKNGHVSTKDSAPHRRRAAVLTPEQIAVRNANLAKGRAKMAAEKAAGFGKKVGKKKRGRTGGDFSLLAAAAPPAKVQRLGDPDAMQVN